MELAKGAAKEAVPMSDEVLAVLTYKSVETCLEVGGTQSWALDRAHAMRCKYVVLCRNGKHARVEGTEDHRAAFLIGTISDVVRAEEREGRWLVAFDRYALLDRLNVWTGGRNPVAYTTLEKLGIDLASLTFQDAPNPATSTHDELEEHAASLHGLTIAQAKAALAITFGVKPEAVEITIRG